MQQMNIRSFKICHIQVERTTIKISHLVIIVTNFIFIIRCRESAVKPELLLIHVDFLVNFEETQSQNVYNSEATPKMMIKFSI
jgi:hypothetical protein